LFIARRATAAHRRCRCSRNSGFSPFTTSMAASRTGKRPGCRLRSEDCETTRTNPEHLPENVCNLSPIGGSV
jgi:hypothetical protein